jgi:antitoxin MazE
MKTTLRKVGNSRGVLIPAALLAECGITNAIDLHLEGHSIIIEAAKPLRAGWFEGYSPEGDVDAWQGFPPNSDCGDWEW